MKRTLLALFLAASLLSTTPRPASAVVPQMLRSLARNAEKLLLERRFAEALVLCQRGYEESVRASVPTVATYLLSMRAAAHFSLGAYRQALDDYILVRDTALRHGLLLRAAAAESGLSSLYAQVFDTQSALAAAEEAYRLVPADAATVARSQILANLGRVLLMRHEHQKALPYLAEAIDLAFRAGESRAESAAWQQLGSELLRAGDLGSAESALGAAYHIRRLTHDPSLYATQYRLAELRLSSGDIESARHLIDAAFAARGQDRAQAPLHLMYATRARILEREGDAEGALADFLHAADAAEEWRRRGLFADNFRISTDVLLQRQVLAQDVGIYDSAIELAAKMYRGTGDPRYSELAWQLKERVRSASLREVSVRGREWTARVPADYWKVLDQLRALEADELGGASHPSGRRDQIVRLRLTLAEMEAQAQSATDGGQKSKSEAPRQPGYHSPSAKYQENFLTGISLNRVRNFLGKSRTLISFHSGTEASYRWVITDRKFELKVLPGRPELQGAINRVREAIAGSRSGPADASEALYRELFGGVAEASGGQWLIALDEGLFDLPLAALVCSHKNGRPTYLIEERALELVPGAWAVSSEPTEAPSGVFVGAGDGIYNTADERYRGENRSLKNILRTGPDTPRTIRQWPRLFASGREISECGRRSGGRMTILTGVELNRKALVAALDSKPAFIHLATHFLWDEGEQKTAVALGIIPRADGAPALELLTPDDVANLSVPGAVVVMSGCSSLKGEVLPAAGLIGLSRAWLAAGAGAVIATLWPTPDDTGELVVRFYEHLRRGPAADRVVPAEALRRAQVDMLHSNTWRADPKYWAAYQVMGRSN